MMYIYKNNNKSHNVFGLSFPFIPKAQNIIKPSKVKQSN